MQALDAPEYKPILASLFDKYVEATMAHCRAAFKAVVALPAVSQAQTVCKILEGILPRVRPLTCVSPAPARCSAQESQACRPALHEDPLDGASSCSRVPRA